VCTKKKKNAYNTDCFPKEGFIIYVGLLGVGPNNIFLRKNHAGSRHWGSVFFENARDGCFWEQHARHLEAAVVPQCKADQARLETARPLRSCLREARPGRELDKTTLN